MLKDLKLNIEAGQFLWSLFKELIITHPIIACIFIFIVLYLVCLQFPTFVDSIKQDVTQKKWGKIVILLLISFIITLIISLNDKPTISIISPVAYSDIIGESVTVNWKLNYDNNPASKISTKDIRYIVEYKGMSKLSPLSFKTFANYHAFIPLEEQFQWRVIAEQKTGIRWKKYSEWSTWQSNKYYETALQRIKKTKVLRVGVSEDYLPPYIYHDNVHDKLDGIDIQIIQLIRNKLVNLLGIDYLNIDYHPNEWLSGNSIDLRNYITDIAIGETAILKEREDKYHIKFTHPYWWSHWALITKKNNKITDFSLLKLTAWRNTTFEQVAMLLTKNYVESNNITEMFDKLTKGEVDGFIDNIYILNYYIKWRKTTNYEMRKLRKKDIPEKFRQKTGYPVPAGIYVDNRENDLLLILDNILKDSRTKENIYQIVKAYRKNIDF